ncbi:MAG: hypothetical protein GSR72_00580 [Desulfurococcales archaeon]|nr:hypothetical protein [Desulfurococcales archaeon]MEB3788373.1 hypothetical protein [Desulfurococcales archaeon]
MAKKDKDKGGKDEKSGKELKIISVQVITPEKVLENERQISLLYVIEKLGPMHEKTLFHILKELKDEYNVDLGYTIRKVGNVPYSPEVKNDLVALLYVGFVETEPNMYRKLRITSKGKDALEQKKPPAGIISAIEKHYEALRNKASMLDSMQDAEIRRLTRTMRRPSRRPPLF